MGGGTWTKEAYRGYADTTNYRTASRAEVFSNSRLLPEFDPSRITLRESCDSADNPNSTPIILGLDVTGSMGEYAERIAKDGLPELMNALLESGPVPNPHIMFMGIDDVHAYSPAALQVSQFEADIRILEQLRKIWLVGRGGGNRSESYDLAWYFAAYKTAIDSWSKRQKKGFCFTFGDEEAPYETLEEHELNAVFGGRQAMSMQPRQVLDIAKERFHVFHVVIEQGSYCRSDLSRVRSTWTEMLGNNVLYLRDFRNLTDVVIATMKIVGGEDIHKVIKESPKAAELAYAFSNSLAD